ncbi:biogenesis of lysosome-related organelles complex-1 subunit 2-domain-containing protein, partial [Geopyxis carbonaria]
TLENLIQLDTEATVGDLDLLVNVNKHAAERYRAMADAAVGLETDAEYLKTKYAEVNKYIKQVDELDERVGDLEKIVKELEEWTGELGASVPCCFFQLVATNVLVEIKVRRLAPPKR